MILNEDTGTGMICVVIVDDGNAAGPGGSGLTAAITVDIIFLPTGNPQASKLLPIFVSMASCSMHVMTTGCIVR